MSKLGDALRRVEQAEADAAALRQALDKYGQHYPTCCEQNEGKAFREDLSCTCGLWGALATDVDRRLLWSQVAKALRIKNFKGIISDQEEDLAKKDAVVDAARYVATRVRCPACDSGVDDDLRDALVALDREQGER